MTDFPFMRLKMPRITNGDVNAKKAHTPKPASHTHDIPFRGTHVWYDFFHTVQPASRVVLGRMLAKLAI